MSLNATPSAERTHISIFGRRNAGKSSIINALTGQDLAIVSDTKGTTTDPVLKAMELLPLGPVVIIDTPGIDDEGKLGALRIQKAYQILNKTDIALLVVDAAVGMVKDDYAILKKIQEKNIPYILVMNKSDLLNGIAYEAAATVPDTPAKAVIRVSTKSLKNIDTLKELIAAQMPGDDNHSRIIADLIQPSDFVVLVVPIDESAPKGRLILPQQQTIRDILDADASAVVIKENDLPQALAGLGKKPALVVTDSQVFAQVAKDTPKDIPLTSFSILFARYKGNLQTVVAGAKALDSLKDGDIILISEGCTHHRQCEDIGTVKLPRMILNYTGKEIHFSFTSGIDFPLDLSCYQIILHCGGCTLNEREMKYRLKCAEDASIPITNYGIAIAHMQGVLERSVEPF